MPAPEGNPEGLRTTRLGDPASYKPGMLVPARIYATERLLLEMDEGVFEQVTNVATLPGIVDYAFCMPDGHWGYGFPIGGVAAFDPRSGVISPGGIGFDINCGMRLVRTDLTEDEVRPQLRELVDRLFARDPRRASARRASCKLSPERVPPSRGAGRALVPSERATAGRRTSSAPRRAAASPAPTPPR